MITRLLRWIDRLVLGPPLSPTIGVSDLVSDDAPVGRIYAQAGEMTTCASGHPVAMMVRDVYVGQPMSWTDFQFVDGCKFLMDACPTCRGPYRDGMSLYYFNGKLRKARK